MSENEDETHVRLVRHLIFSALKRRPIKREDLTALLKEKTEKKAVDSYISKLQQTLEKVFWLGLREIGSKHRGKRPKRYLVVSTLGKPQRNKISKIVSRLAPWWALPAVTLLVLYGEELTEAALMKHLSKLGSKDPPKEILRQLKAQHYLDALAKSTEEFGKRETVYTLGQRALLEFTLEDIQNYLQELCFSFTDNETLARISQSVTIGAVLLELPSATTETS